MVICSSLQFSSRTCVSCACICSDSNAVGLISWRTSRCRRRVALSGRLLHFSTIARKYLSAVFTTLTTDVDGFVSFPYVLKEIKLNFDEQLKYVWCGGLVLLSFISKDKAPAHSAHLMQLLIFLQ